MLKSKNTLTVILTLVLAVVLTVTVFALDIYEIPQTVEIPEGAYGVLQIPCIGTNSPLYEGRDFQSIIDDENSALIRRYKRGWYIGDHAGSEVGGGFWYVEDITVGSAAFIIRDGEPTKAYLCTSVYFLHQNGWDYAYHGTTVNPTRDGFICVSCSDYDDWVYLACFEYVEDMP